MQFPETITDLWKKVRGRFKKPENKKFYRYTLRDQRKGDVWFTRHHDAYFVYVEDVYEIDLPCGKGLLYLESIQSYTVETPVFNFKHIGGEIELEYWAFWEKKSAPGKPYRIIQQNLWELFHKGMMKKATHMYPLKLPLFTGRLRYLRRNAEPEAVEQR